MLEILITILIVLVCAGAAVALIGYFPIAEPYKGIAKLVILFCVVIWILLMLLRASPRLGLP
jgi:hypothetical protein